MANECTSIQYRSSPEKTIIKVESNGAKELLTSELLQPIVFTQQKGLQLQSFDEAAALLKVDRQTSLQPASLTHSTRRRQTTVQLLEKEAAVAAAEEGDTVCRGQETKEQALYPEMEKYRDLQAPSVLESMKAVENLE
ncbi:Hypothetical predicted protein [Podarcis lilfordi]|uniref:Uncharacterized protein n=1 Tax=Podarcis lilfordi TaxID=74358 RepID=A0AA35NUF1_9SAUR|nr:Hypothetical predicted protein [Podarcis lilfordi]